MTIHEFDTLAGELRSLELPESTQRRHLAMLAGLLADAGNADDAGAVRAGEPVDSADTTAGLTTAGTNTAGTNTAGTSTGAINTPGTSTAEDATASDTTADRPEGATVLRPRFSRGKRTAVIAGSVVVLAGAGIGTAAAFGAFSEPTDRAFSHCYTAPDLQAPHNDFALATDSGTPGDSAAEALDICSRDWANGRLRQGADQLFDATGDGRSYPVPPLVVCVLESGQVGVFPGEQDTCHRLGLPIADL